MTEKHINTMKSKRIFGSLDKSYIGILFMLLSFSVALSAQETKQLVVLHLNDTHSRIEPMPPTDARNANIGGVIRQDAYVKEVRSESPNVLLFHCGDFVQGTPYFNMFKGKAEIAFMNAMKFDAACIGNHEFDYGLELMAEIVGDADFPFISTNYDFLGTPMEGLTKKYLILEQNELKIGIIGIGIQPEGLVARQNYEGTKYLDPIETANETARFLKEDEQCDLIICLSHLGYYPSEDRMGDITLAKKSRYIDIILGGHSHTFLQQPDRRQNLDGKEVLINQMGHKGFYIGRLDITMQEEESK